MPPAQRLRFAPSPTGYLHIGGARTALFNWLYARGHGGVFILRVEDTDQERSTPESVQAILEGLQWLGIDWDEGPGKEGPYAPYFQTQRLSSYRHWAEKMIEAGTAYRCYCTREQLEERRAFFEKQKLAYKYEGTCRNLRPEEAPRDKPHVVRFKLPTGEGSVSFEDKVIGKITKLYSDLDDSVLLRADDIPLYNFGCVVDDHTMDITLVCRGQEHINSTFPQLMIYQALGWQPPQFAHLPLILGVDREKLSKRRHPEADVTLHKKNGILPEALLNFVVRLGWSHGNDETISRDEMIRWFDFDHVGTTSGVWNPDKLLWLNQHYLKTLEVTDVAGRFFPFLKAHGLEAGFTVDEADPRLAKKLEKVVLALRERVKTLKEMAETGSYFFSRGVKLDEKAAAKFLNATTRPVLEAARAALAAAPSWSAPLLDEAVKHVSEKLGVGMGKVAQPLRVAVTGNTASPGIGETLEIVGQEETLQRLDEALSRSQA